MVATGAALRLFRLGEPLGYDEGFSWMWAHLPHSAIWGYAARYEYNPPLFYSLQRIWLAFGDSEAIIRSLPAVFGILLIPVVFGIGRATGGSRTGLLAALLAATSAPLVAYSQQARMYSFLCLVAGLAVLGQILFLRTWVDRRRWPVNDPMGADPAQARLLGLALYAGGTSLALYAHNTAVLMPVLANLVAAYWWLGPAARSWRFAAVWVSTNLVPLALWLWWVPTLLAQARDPVQNALQYLEQPSPAAAAFRTVRLYAQWYLSVDKSPLQVIVPIPVLAVAGAWTWRSRKSPLLVLVAFAAGLPLLAYAIGVVRPVWVERVVLWSVPFGLVLVAAGIEAFRSQRVRMCVLDVVLVAQAANLAGYYATPNAEPMAQATRAIAASFAPGDAVVVYPVIEAGPFAYYARRAGVPGPRYILTAVPLLPGYPRVDAVQINTTYVDGLGRLRTLAAHHRRFWVVARALSIDHPEALTAALGTLGTVVEQREYPLSLRLFLVRVGRP